MCTWVSIFIITEPFYIFTCIKDSTVLSLPPSQLEICAFKYTSLQSPSSIIYHTAPAAPSNLLKCSFCWARDDIIWMRHRSDVCQPFASFLLALLYSVHCFILPLVPSEFSWRGVFNQGGCMNLHRATILYFAEVMAEHVRLLSFSWSIMFCFHYTKWTLKLILIHGTHYVNSSLSCNM